MILIVRLEGQRRVFGDRYAHAFLASNRIGMLVSIRLAVFYLPGR